jgi:hypothetical protein
MFAGCFGRDDRVVEQVTFFCCALATDGTRQTTASMDRMQWTLIIAPRR